MIAAIYARKSTEQNDVTSRPLFGPTLTEDRTGVRGLGHILRSSHTDRGRLVLA